MPILGASPAAVVPLLPGRRVTAAPDATPGLATPPLPAGIAPWNFILGQVGGAVTSRVFTVPANQPPTQQGDTLLITLNIASNAMTVSAVVDSAGNTYTLDSASSTTAPQQRNYRCANANPVAPGQTVTVTTSATNANLCLAGLCIPGAAWEGTPDVIGTVSSSASVGSLTQSITPTGDYELILFINVNQSIGGPNYTQPPFFGQWLNTGVPGTNEVTYSYLACGAGTAGVAQSCTVNFGQANNARMGGWAFTPNQIALADAAAAVDAITSGPGFAAATGLTSGAGTSRTAAVSTATAAGDTLLALVTTQATACTISALTDSKGNVYTLDRSNTSALPLAYYFRSPGATGGPGGGPTAALATSDTLTATSAAQTGNVEILLVDIGPVGAVDQISAVATGTTGTPTASATPTANGEICVGLLASSNTGGQPAVASPYALVSTYHTGVNIYNTAASQQLATGTGSGVAQTFTATITPIAWNAVQYTFQPGAVPKMATLTDAFPGTSVDTTKWTAFPAAGGSVGVSGGLLSLTDTASAALFSVLQSNAAYDLTGSYLLAQLASAGTQAASTLALMKIQADANNSAQILVQNGQLACQHQVAGSFGAFLATATYSATAHKWLRLREASGTLFYEYSADGAAWTALYSEAAPITLTSLTASMQEGSTGTTDPAATSQWASVNLPATPVTQADVAAAADALSVSATVNLTDTGAGAEAAAATVTVPLAEWAGAADTAAQSAAVPLADQGAGADTISSTASVPMADAGAAADVVATPQRTIPLADAAGAAEAAQASVTAPLADTAGAADVASQAVTVSLADAGAAAETMASGQPVSYADAAGAAEQISVAETTSLAEAAGAAEAFIVTVAVPLPEQAGAADAPVISGTVPLSERAAAADALPQPPVSVGPADAAAGADQLSASATAPLADTAAGTEASAVAATVPLAEAAGAADSLSIPAKTLPVPDAGGAADSITAAVTSPAADVAGAADALTVQQGIFIAFADSAGAAEAATVAAAVPVADQAAAADQQAIGMPVALADIGAAADSATAAAAVPLADTAAGTDTLSPPAAAVPLADQAGAADAESVAAGANPALNDTAAAAEQIAATASVPMAEAAGAAEQISVVAGQQVTLADAAGAADALAVQVQVPLPDAAGAADGLTAAVAAAPVLADAAGVTDALRAAVAAPSHDVAAASETFTATPATDRVVSDSAGAADSLRVTIPTITPQPVWRCGALAQRWFCAAALQRWLVAAVAARWETEPSPPRWAVNMLAARWEAIMTEFAAVASISKANVNVVWTSDLAGSTEDPTVAPMVVRFAFPASSGDENAPAQPSAWFDGAWVAPPSGGYKGYIAQCPVGPLADGGLVQLTRGRYDVWSEVQAGDETPRQFVGVLPVY